jgi:hypothetical protein
MEGTPPQEEPEDLLENGWEVVSRGFAVPANMGELSG